MSRNPVLIFTTSELEDTLIVLSAEACSRPSSGIRSDFYSPTSTSMRRTKREQAVRERNAIFIFLACEHLFSTIIMARVK